MSEYAVVPYSEVERMAVAVVSSKMFPGITTKESAVALMLLCQSEGLHPMQALTRYHIIQGRPAMKSDAMLAEFMRRGGMVDWKEWTNEVCEAVFVSKGCPSGVTVRWTIEDAKRAGVTSNPTWTKYPRQMLKARVASDGVRMADPAVNQGRHTPEEVEDFTEDNPKAVPAEVEIVTEAVEDIPLSCGLKGCKSPIAEFESDSKQFKGRRYFQCKFAYQEKQRLIATGRTNAEANAAVSKHYREWGEPWPRQSEAGGPEASVGASESPAPAETPIMDKLQAISDDVAQRVAAEGAA